MFKDNSCISSISVFNWNALHEGFRKTNPLLSMLLELIEISTVEVILIAGINVYARSVCLSGFPFDDRFEQSTHAEACVDCSNRSSNRNPDKSMC